ncbi:MAG: hypothetical protein OXF27_17975 [Acidobacteria bacterium]|nr:hypothetical protein [Acidobacteriota bacterium]
MTASTSSIRSAVLLAALAGVTACANYYEVPVETPLEPKLDVSDFQRVLVAGFVAGGSEEVDTNLETARLLRSQLRNNSEFQVIDADVLELTSVAEDQAQGTPEFETLAGDGEDNGNGNDQANGDEEDSGGYSEEDLEVLEHIFANASYWQELGEEHQQPLIITGTVYFTPHQRSGMVTRQREVYDEFGRRQVAPVRAYRDRRGYILSPKFIFIDGRTGATLYTERHREEILYDASRNTPALSSYFELMDRLIPSFLGTLSAESIKGTRILLK